MSLIVALALMGLFFGGFRGLVLGALLGIGARFVLRNVVIGGGMRQPSQLDFLDSSFAVMGALAKADGVVTRDEIDSAKRIFDMLRLSEAQREQARDAFKRGKAPEFDLDAEIDRLRGAIGFGRGPLLRLFLQLQVMAVAADGRVHTAEHTMLVHIARGLGLTERDVAQLEALLRTAGTGAGAGAGPGAGTGRGAGPRAAPSASRLDDAFAALGLVHDATDAEIKRAYRRLVSQNHPDKLATRNLPDSMKKLAEERIREINVAYELIKESRGFN